jgi:hypothetical protein
LAKQSIGRLTGPDRVGFAKYIRASVLTICKENIFPATAQGY